MVKGQIVLIRIVLFSDFGEVLGELFDIFVTIRVLGLQLFVIWKNMSQTCPYQRYDLARQQFMFGYKVY